MSISLCVITRNAGASIARCLLSAKTIVSEILVVDSGSTDATVRVAEMIGAKVYHMGSRSFSYSVARNLALSKATGDWILVLDSDEALDAQSERHIHSLVQGEHPAYALLVQNYFANGRWSSTPVTRLFRRDPSVYYEKNIHETVNYSLQRLGIVPQIVPVLIHHFGYIIESNRVNSKTLSYKDLLERQISVTPNDAASWWYLALALGGLGEYDDAISAARRAIDIEPHNKIPRIFLARLLRARSQFTGALEALEESLQINEQSYWDPTIHNLLGMIHLTLGKYDVAEEHLSQTLAKEPDYPHSWINMGILFEKSGRHEEALRCFLEAGRLNPMLFQVNASHSPHPYGFQEDVSEYYIGLSRMIEQLSSMIGAGAASSETADYI